MQLGKVVGTVVSTKKDEKLEGLILQMVQYMDADCKPIDKTVIAVDSVGAGVGEMVLVATGSAARLTGKTDGRPVDATIVSIVDTLEASGTKYKKA